jgi:hypothetical protein
MWLGLRVTERRCWRYAGDYKVVEPMENIKIEIFPYDEIVAMRQNGFIVIAIKESAVKRWGITLALRIVKLIKSMRGC